MNQRLNFRRSLILMHSKRRNRPANKRDHSVYPLVTPVSFAHGPFGPQRNLKTQPSFAITAVNLMLDLDVFAVFLSRPDPLKSRGERNL